MPVDIEHGECMEKSLAQPKKNNIEAWKWVDDIHILTLAHIYVEYLYELSRCTIETMHWFYIFILCIGHPMNAECNIFVHGAT